MICSISCRCSSDRHPLASHWLFHQFPSSFFCERNSLKEARFFSHRKIDDQNWGLQSFGSGFHSCKLVGHQSLTAFRFGLRTFSILDAWPIEKSSCILCTRKSRLGKTQSMAGSKCGTNAAMEVCYGTDSSKADPVNTSENLTKQAMEVCYGTDSSKADPVDTLENLTKQANATAALPGFICTTVGKSTNIAWQECIVKKEERQKLLGQKGCVIWITGLSGSGKSTLACTLDHALLKRGNLSYIIDGDNVRHGLNNNLGFCAEDRAENIRRVGEVAKLFADAGLICIASLISPYRKDRDACRQLLHVGEFIEVHMNFPVSLCEERDPKGLYKLARAGKIKGFTGVDDPYEAPLNCEVVLQLVNGRCPTPVEMTSQLISFLEERQILGPPR